MSFELEPLADPAVSELTVQLPAAFWAFHRQYYGAYREYARLQLGDAHSGSQLAHRVFMHLAMNWAGLMEEENPAACAWALLKEAVAAELEVQGRQAAIGDTAVLTRVTRAVLESYRQQFAAMETALGLYNAIARLPERQFDVVILQHVLGYTTERTAQVMGVSEGTVRSHCFHARRKLAKELQLGLGREPVEHRGDRDDEE
ncbi:RNA polymerase sigma factor [Streptomyces mangrovi]|uniref:RNA polymerase sigma factor n=1 Tax=Streptomyces mangrovi TaxID=1206892 RepID=UPI00399D48EF